jgi:hypothetical protein
MLQAGDCRVWALCNLKNQGFHLFTLLHIDIGLTLQEERRLSRGPQSSIFIQIAPLVQLDTIKVSNRYKTETYSFLTCDDMTIKLWTQEP